MAASVAAPRGLMFVVIVCCVFVGVRGNILRLFSANPPAFVNVSDLKLELRTLVDSVGNRMRCEEHGLEHAECVQCLDPDSIITLLNLDPASKSFSRQKAEDLAVYLIHQILYFESMCISREKECLNIQECQDEVIKVMGSFANPSESLVKVLRIFKLYLKEEGDKECFNAQEILEDLPHKNLPRNEVKGLRQAFSLLMGHVFQGRCIGIGESVTDFLDDIFHHYGDNCSPYMSLEGLKRLVHDLQSGKGDDHDHNHHHSHHHDNNHDDNHDCDHKHAHFAHYHGGHFHGPSSYSDHNSSHGHLDHHAHGHSSHDHSDHDHSHHDHEHYDHDHSDHDHDHLDHDHSGHDHSEDHHHPDHSLSHREVDNSQLSGIFTPSGNDLKHTDFEYTEDYSARLSPSVASSDKVNISSVGVVDEDQPTTSSSHTYLTTATRSVQNPSSTPATIINTPPSTFSSASTGNDSEGLPEDSLLKDNSTSNKDQSESRARRSTLEHEEFNGPAASLRSDLSHQEEEERIEEPASSDDVKKVYLLQNDHNQNANLELSGTPHQFASLAAKCLSAEELIAKFGLRENGTLTKSDFIDLCPALIQQAVSGVCTESALPPPPLPSRMEVYGYGTLSVFIISLTSLAGVLLLPIMTKMAYNYIVAGFYGLAFSTLAADAMLHLMPQFLGLHSHGAGGADHGHSHDGGFLEPYAQLQLGVFFTIYGLFLFEAIMGAISGNDQHTSQESKGHGHSHSHFPDELPTLISVKTKSEIQLNVSRDQSSSSLDTEIVEMESIKKPPNLMVSKPVFLGMTSMAIVVTLGDSLHNFGDGLAIGAAFSTGIRGGLSTAIAVFCHEVPHEFGDFVVLLSTGLSFSKSLWINFMSGLTCFAGLYLGILIGDNEEARKWVMAVTAGIFLYVALGEMLPELREHTHGNRFVLLLIKNVGILAGLGIMLLISVYEDQIA